MIKELITDFFNEIEKRELKKNKNAKATFWVDELQKVGFNDKNYIGIKKATRLYEKYIEDKKNVSVKEPDKFLCDVMAQYLNHENYEQYKSKKEASPIFIKLSNQNKKLNVKEQLSLNKIVIIAGILVIVPILFSVYMNNNSDTNKCIIWNVNFFRETSCTAKNAINNARYNINIDQFKKIEVSHETTFFLYGNPIIWYGKSSMGEINFFTHRGVHPETLKELKPVTKYIIKKYVRKDKNNKTALD